MPSPLLSLLAIASAVGCGLIAGTFFAFSCFVMRALAKLPAAQGIAAMQSINVVVLNPLFLGTFLGTAILCVGAGIVSVLNGVTVSSAWIIAGGILYVGGNIFVTGACNIPRNNALAALDPTSAAAARYWTEYVATWTAWNHVRTLTATVAMISFIIGLLVWKTVT